MSESHHTRFQQFRDLLVSKHATEEKNFKDVLKDLADSSSLHGVPKIVSSRQIAVKVLWCLLFVATFSVLVYQLTGLFRTFYSHPIQTTVSLEFSSINFPAISICNMNPVRDSKLEMSDALVDVAKENELKNPGETATYSQSDTSMYNPSSDTSTYNPSMDTSMYNPPSDTSTNNPPSDTSTNNPPSDTSINNPPSDTSTNNQRTTSSSSSPKSYTSSSNNDPWQSPDSYYDYWSEWYQNNGYSDFNENYYDSGYNNYYYYNSWEESVDPKMLIYQQLSAKRDEWDERADRFRTVFKNINLEKRQLMGHQKEDLIMAASFAGRIENVTRFQNFTSSEFGNCYTMSSPKYVAWRSGPSHGIKMTLNVEVDEYVPSFSTGYGVRLVIHEPGTYPLPSNEGITLGPGTETNIGLKMVRLSRLGQPYGSCMEGQEFFKRYRKKYSTSACNHFCRLIKAMEVCECIPVDAPDDIQLNTTVLPVCNISDNTEKLCLLNTDLKFNEGEYACDCHGPCREIIFERTMSSRYWPTMGYLSLVLHSKAHFKTGSLTFSQIKLLKKIPKEGAIGRQLQEERNEL